MIICKLCGTKCKTVGKLTAHRFSAHPEIARKSLRKSINGRSKNLIEHKKELSAKDLLDILKVKRDALNEIISEAEKHVI